MTEAETQIEPDYKRLLNTVALALDEMFNGKLEGTDRHTGFALLVFPFDGRVGGPERCDYISNAERADVLVVLQELVARFEGRSG